MKNLLILLAFLLVFASCNRSTCPAYMNGESTGASGSTKGKKQELFPKEMKKKN